MSKVPLRCCKLHLVVPIVLVALICALPLRLTAAAASLDATPPAAGSTRSPAAAVPLAGWATQVATGTEHTCAVTLSGGVKCWGDNRYGQLGDGTTQGRVIPVDVVGLANDVQAIAAGEPHLRVDHSRRDAALGWNAYGQLGNGTVADRTTPGAVVGLAAGVQVISAGYNFACAMIEPGDIKCWGANSFGQLGDGTTEARLTPTAVVGLPPGIQAISTGGGHTCALTERDGVYCWGSNSQGQLGNGSLSLRPVAVVGLPRLSTPSALVVLTPVRSRRRVRRSAGVPTSKVNSVMVLWSGASIRWRWPVCRMG